MVTTAIWIALAAMAASQPEPTGSIPAMTLTEALDYARLHQPSLLALRARVEAQKAEAQVPRGAWLPLVGASVQVFEGTANTTSALNLESSVMSIPRIGGTPLVSAPSEPGIWKGYGSTFAGVGISQEVFDFGRIAARTAAQDALAAAEQGRSDAALLDLDFNVEESFFAVLAAKGVLKAAQDSQARAQAHRDFAYAGVKEGLRDPIELARAEAELSQAATRVVRAQGGVAEAQSFLAAAVGVPDLKLDTSGTAPKPGELPSLEQSLDAAARRDPRLRAAIASLEAQQATTRATSRYLLPNLRLTASFSGRAGGAPGSDGVVSDTKGWLPDIPNWDVGLLLTIPLYDASLRAEIDASRATEEALDQEVASARLTQRTTVQKALIAAQVALEALPTLERSVAAGTANYAQAEARFRAGLGSAVELADAENLRTEAEIELALGRFEVARSRAALSRATAETL
jgi:outer membrane protein